MAGLPQAVLERSRDILSELETGSPAPRTPTKKQSLQLSLFEAAEPEVVTRLRELDVNDITPLEAMRILADMQKTVR